MERVSHDGRETAYRQTSDEPARLLYVHGSGATHRLWGAQYAADARAVALDLSGHGDSTDVDAAPGPETLAAYAADVTAVARATGARVLVGSSLGGAVALHVALESRFEPSALVLAGVGATFPVDDRLLAWLEDDFERAVDYFHGPDRLFHHVDDRTREASRAQLRRTGPEVVRRDLLTSQRFDVGDRLEEVTAPALAVAGEHDSLVLPRCTESLAAGLPGGEYREIDGAAHLPMLECPEAFDTALRDFLDARGL